LLLRHLLWSLHALLLLLLRLLLDLLLLLLHRLLLHRLLLPRLAVMLFPLGLRMQRLLRLRWWLWWWLRVQGLLLRGLLALLVLLRPLLLLVIALRLGPALFLTLMLLSINRDKAAQR